MTRSENESIMRMQEQQQSETYDHMECTQVLKLNKANKWHKNIMQGMNQCKLKCELSVDQLRALNYFHTVHQATMSMSSLKQIEESLL